MTLLNGVRTAGLWEIPAGQMAAQKGSSEKVHTFVMNHMKMLESTGLVQYEKLPPAAMPPTQDLSAMGIAVANTGLEPPVSPLVLWTLLAGAVGLGGLATMRILRTRS